MSDNLSDILDKIRVQCIFFEFTINGRTCNTQFFHYPRNGNSAVFNSFLEYFALMRHVRYALQSENTKMSTTDV